MRRVHRLVFLFLVAAGVAISWNTLRSQDRDHTDMASPPLSTPRPVLPQQRMLPATSVSPTLQELYFRAKPGQQFIFALQVRWLNQVAAEAETAQPHAWTIADGGFGTATLDLTATLRVTVLAYEDPYFILRFNLSDLRFIGNVDEKHQPGILLDSLDKPTLVRFQDDGRINGYRFEDKVQPLIKHLVATIISLSHQFVADNAETKTIISGLHDANGVFTGLFAWETPKLLNVARLGDSPVQIVRQRTVLHYDQDDQASGRLLRVVRSESEASFDNGWIAHAAAEEEREANIHNALRIISKVSLKMTRTGGTFVVIDPAMLPSAVQWEFPAANTKEGTPAKDEVIDPVEARKRTIALLGTLDDLIRSGQYDGQEAMEAWAALAKLIGQQPQAVLSLIVEHLQAGDLDVVTQRYVISSIGKAGGGGTIEAVEMLVELLNEPNADEERKLAIIVASHQLGPHAAPILDSLESFVQKLRPLGEDSSLSSAAALAIGTLNGAPGLTGKECLSKPAEIVMLTTEPQA